MTEKHLIDLINRVVDQYELDHGNGYVDVDFDYKIGSLIVESPHHSFVDVNLNPLVRYIVNYELEPTPENDKFVLGNIKRLTIKGLEDFSTDDNLNDFYDPSYTELCNEFILNPNFHFGISRYLEMKHDEDDFKEKACLMKEEIEGIPSVEELK